MNLSHLHILIFTLLILACQPGFHEKNGFPRYQKKAGILLSPQARLRKLSLHVRGAPPTLDEYEALKTAMNKGDVSNFFKAKVSAYINSPEHLGKMIDRLDELFGVRVSPKYLVEKYFWEIPEKIYFSEIDYNSMDLLFQRVVKENLDWNYLFTAKEYRLLNPPQIHFGHISDLGFYNVIRPDLPPSSDGTVRVPNDQDPSSEKTFLALVFAANDARVAGAFTTSRFTTRYNTTLLNKNRKRAAAMFRILLCDDMKPLIPADEDITDIVNKSFPKPENVPPQTVLNDEIKHGSQQSCFACHQKLDPMGEVFRMTGNVLGAEQSPGALVYPTTRGELINVPVQGIGQATQAATEQIEYKNCQVRRFWDWFIGKDIPLNQTRLQELTTEFERLNHKPNDFAAFLVQQPEFQIDHSGTFSRDVTFSEVKPILKQCTLCHTGITDKNIPSFEALPFGGDSDTHKLWLGKIIAALDLKGDGASAIMPPRNSGWILSTEERQGLQDWISAGAQDENGKRTSEDKIPFTAGEKKTGVFGYASLRYVASADILRVFSQRFPHGWDDGSLCTTHIDQKAMGYFNPANQEPFLKGPSLAFVKWFTKCLLDVSEAEFKKIKSQNLDFDRYLGEAVLKKIKNTPFEDLRKNADSFPWVNISSEIQISIISHMIEDTIGWQVAGRQNEISDKILKAIGTLENPMATQGFQEALLVIMLQDEFLTY